ncbi:MAG: alkene reductase [Gammaproteobacteria bacterium]
MLLFSSHVLGSLTLPNRIVMAPMTRNRAVGANVPHSAAPLYYSQRASAGLIITEGSQVSPKGVGYVRTPGLHSGEQVEAWQTVTDAVHGAGGRIFAQLWHTGRVSHPDFLEGELPVAPSAITPEGEVTTPLGRKPLVTPRELPADEMPSIVEAFRWAAQNAKTAGFDGVEIHGANSYLLDQFLRDGSNRRTDEYGGSVRNRARFPLDITDAVIDVWGADRVGYRVSPNGSGYSMSDSDPVATFSYMAEALNERRIAYLHVLEPVAGRGAVPAEVTKVAPFLRRLFRGSLILNGGYDAHSAEAVLASGDADFVSFGVPYLANPDLVERFQRQAPLNEPDFATFFQGEEKGYVDYPALAR